ncbi:hypothetical protein EYR40_002725 [Pleurotus pulmonarius]|nr:hypothetical protein EYR40_002725 [Pleurotus pulmonarius]
MASSMASPTNYSLDDARRSLAEDESALGNLIVEIDQAEATLERLVAQSKKAIEKMVQERRQLEEKMFQTKAYLSPIRRLPIELLRTIFLFNFEDYPCCAWVLASVSTPWRKLALSMPKLWSKIRLITTQQSSADTIRLWLERSGTTCPLDIEIFLRVTKSTPDLQRSGRASSPATWPCTHTAQQYFIPPPTATSSTTVTILPPANTPIIIPPSPAQSDSWSASSSPTTERPPPIFSRSSMHWAHIAIFYLVEQMSRWERFVFRFDKQFPSAGALRSITGDAPLLRVFEVSSAESSYYTDWQWLPCASSGTPLSLPKLENITLQNTPFKWSSPMFQTNLRSLTLRALQNNHLSLDRILCIVSANPNLESLSLHFSGVLPPILPMHTTTLASLKELSIGGHYLFFQLVDSLLVPNIESLSLDIEPREPVEDAISNLLIRSGQPPLAHLSVAYGNSNSSTFYYGPAGFVISWNVLSELNHLQSLRIGSTSLEPLLTALGPPDEDSGQSHWACPNLTSLGMKNCHAHSEGIAKLVQMVDARNPSSGGGGSTTAVNGVAPVKLRSLELYDCATLGEDVIGWLKGRIDDVTCTEPAFERLVPVNLIG